ncbi:fibronectin type III domain-containing protein-like [Montipora capricornis]|uniref:fibronectin type III domain-containing protein-like n=1 Tax=Montipora capricornis TaxID=246305 RepID=UPI0035F1A135
MVTDSCCFSDRNNPPDVFLAFSPRSLKRLQMNRVICLIAFLIVALTVQRALGQGSKPAPPQITEFLQNDLVAPDEVKFRDNVNWQLNLPCRATGSNKLSWEWKHNDSIINPNKFEFNDDWQLSQDGTLKAKGLSISDSGTYQCFVTDTVTGVKTFSRKLRVAVTGVRDPAIFSIPSFTSATSNSVQVAVEGRSKVLYCLATARPFPTITWKKNGKELRHGVDFFEIPSQLKGRLLNITKVDENMHEDIYTCQASNNQATEIGPQERNINLRVEVAPRWNVEPPRVKKFPIASSANLSCDVYAEPEPQIKWFRDGVELVPSSKVRQENTDLLFSDLTLNEAGIYQCVAENKHGMIVSSTYVEVLAIAPSFQKNGFGPFYLFQESEGRLKCDPEAAPRPTVFTWYKDAVNITPGVTYQIENDGTLVISNVQRRRDQGKYACYAENFLGSDLAESTAIVYEKTRIILAPKDRNVNEGSRVDLRCEAQVDDRLELHYLWKRDDAIIEYNQRVTWERNVLTIADLTVEDGRIYTCLAYTPYPKRSEDSASATIDIAGAPYPPYNLKLCSDCQNRNTTLTWVTGGANQAPITYFLVERKSTYADDFWQVIANVTKPNANSYALVKMAGNADLAFRVRAVNGFGPSRSSKPTSSVCRTDAAAPDKWPDNFRGIPGKAEQLDIGWTAIRMVEWNGPGLSYKLWYKRVGPANSLVEIQLDDPKTERFNIPNAGYYVQWEFRIQAINDIAPGPKSPFVKAFSGQDPPAGRPEDVTVGTETARSVELSWKPVTVTRGSVDGYRIYCWGESLVPAKRRRAIPTFALSTNVTGGGTQSYNVTGLKPYTRYTIAVTAYNSGGDGPESVEVKANTLEAEPGPPSNVKIYAFAKYILVRWEPPLESNGIITKYRIGSNTFTGSQHNDVEITNMQETKADVREKLLGNMEPETNNVIEIQAMTAIGWGEGVRKTKRTVPWSAPAKPEKPELEGTAVNKVRVYYKFGLGGGYTHEFLVMYRKKGNYFYNLTFLSLFRMKIKNARSL